MTVNLNIKVGNTTLNVPARVASQQQKSLIGKMKSAANVLKGSNEMQIKASVAKCILFEKTILMMHLV